MYTEAEIQADPEYQMRVRKSEEKTALQNQIAQLRLQGKTFDEIAGIVSFHERHVRRLYHQFLFYKNEFYDEWRNLILGEFRYNYEYSIELCNRQLAQAITEKDPKMILLWQKTRQDALRDYHTFLKDMGLSHKWISEDLTKPWLSPDRKGQPWVGESELDLN